ncbi:hypothetical protein QVD99_005806 [Batrachochytrium dendrobatidis]|nr:hypothetical protein O5D80_000714 [Batrachochytrium dendrobatidis]KAK5667695.1 hypothetical protein QVD99_005806 [Batrachochytrium dendrobatidis]
MEDSQLPDSTEESSRPALGRFVDYFFQAGLDHSKSLIDRRLPVICDTNGSLIDLSVIEVKSPAQLIKEANTGNTSCCDKPKEPNGVDGKQVHPLKYHFQAETIQRYPKQDWSDTEKFPAYVPMFCFPNDLTLVYDESQRPPDTFHSFIITEENGAKCYGTCIIIYEKPSEEIRVQLQSLISEWEENNLAESDIEYVQHVKSQLEFHKEKLRLLQEYVNDSVDLNERRELEAAEEEKVCIYEELLTPLKQTILANLEHVYVPRCLGLLSHWPWYNILKDWLCELVRMVRNADSLHGYIPLERCIVNIIHEIPLPPPGKLEIVINIGDQQLHCSRPPVNTIPTLKNFSMYPIFCAMSLHHIILAFELILTERKVIFLSSHYSMLNLASEAFCHLLFPLYWHHILIPVLPSRLISYLQAPMPYIVGVHRKYFGKFVEQEWRPSDASVVDLDNDMIDLSHPIVGLPTRERRKLIARLEKHAAMFFSQTPGRGSPDCAEALKQRHGIPLTMQQAFPNQQQVVLTGDSLIGLRKVQDIPKSMYTKFSNDFLQAKSNSPMRSNISPNRTRGNFAVPSYHSNALQNQNIAIGASQSFNNIASNGDLSSQSFMAQNSFFGLPYDSFSADTHRNCQKNNFAYTDSTIQESDSIAAIRDYVSTHASNASRPSTDSLSPDNPHRTPSRPHSDGDAVDSDDVLNWSNESGDINAESSLKQPSSHALSNTQQPIQDTANLKPSVAGSESRSNTSLKHNEERTQSKGFSWWSPSRTEQKKTTENDAKLPGLESLFGSFNISQGEQTQFRSRLRPSSTGPEILRQRPSSAGPDFPSRSTSTNRGLSFGGGSTSPRKNMLARFWGGQPSVSDINSSVSVGDTNDATSPAIISPTPTPCVNIYTNNTVSSQSLPSNLQKDVESPLNVSFSQHDELRGGMNGICPYDSTIHSPPIQVMLKEGHIFHELIPILSPTTQPVALDRIADIEMSDTGSNMHSSCGSSHEVETVSHNASKFEDVEELADRFGLDSQSSDDYTRSEVSMDTRNNAGRFTLGGRRMGGGSTAGSTIATTPSYMNFDTRDRRHSSINSALMLSRRETVRTNEVPVCRMCRKNLDIKLHKVFMCECCHIQIHSGCIALTDAHPCGIVFSEEKIRYDFFRMFTSLLKTYRNHLGGLFKSGSGMSRIKMALNGSNRNAKQGPDQTDINPLELNGEDWFHKQEFLSDFDTETRAFMSQVIETQAFAQFILDRVERPDNDYEILFFDESIKAKLNRSKLRFTKEATPFLRDPSYMVANTFQTLSPNLDDVPPGYRPFDNDLFRWNEDMAVAPRQIEPLLSDSDIRMMQSHTNELVQRARLESSMKRKQDFYKWMRTKMKYFQKIGGGEVVSIGFATDDQRRELLEERLEEVSSVIAEYEHAHVDILTLSEVRTALGILHSQNKILVRAADEEQLVESSDEDELQLILSRLIRVITIYEDHQSKLEIFEGSPSSSLHSTEQIPDSTSGHMALSVPTGQSDSVSTNAGTDPSHSHKQGRTTPMMQSFMDVESVMEPTSASTPLPKTQARVANQTKAIGKRVAEWAADIVNANSGTAQANTVSVREKVLFNPFISTVPISTPQSSPSVTTAASTPAILSPPIRPPPPIPSLSSPSISMATRSGKPLPTLPKVMHHDDSFAVPHLLEQELVGPYNQHEQSKDLDLHDIEPAVPCPASLIADSMTVIDGNTV